MEFLLILLAFPIIWPFIAKKIWHDEISWPEVGINISGVAILVTAVWFFGQFNVLSDTEIWNGEIISKHREHGSWIETYQCNCYQSCSGTGSSRSCSTICSTCTRTHYTAEWFAKVDFGGAPYHLRLDYLDTTSRSRRDDANDPVIYRNCAPGQPASIPVAYDNYVQAVPDSLFNSALSGQAYAEFVPDQPRVYGKYRINRVLNVGSELPTAQIRDLNDRLSLALRELGPARQVNVNVIVTEIDDQAFRHTVENAWIGGEKNDVTVFLGLNGSTFTWVDVMTFAHNKGNELFQVKLRDSLRQIGTFDPAAITAAIDEMTMKHYDRIEMAEFQYLEDQIMPPNWVIALAAFLSVAGSIGLSFVMRVVEIGHTRGYTGARRFGIYRRYR